MIRKTARQFPNLTGRAAWDEILGPRPAFPTLEQDATYDVAIIGGGFAGLSAARRLLQIDETLKICILDAQAIAQGGTGRNSGFMIDLPHELTSDDYAGSGDERRLIALNRYAQSFAAQAVEDYAIDPNYFDRAGKINGAVSKTAQHHNQTYAQHLASLGERYEILDAQQMHDITGSHHYQSGLYTPGTVMLQPAGYVRGLATGLAQSGVAIFENSPVVEFEKQSQTWRIKTAQACVCAGKVILGVNGHLESFGYARGRLMQVFLFASMTPELDQETLARLGGQPRWGITPSDPMGTTMRRIDTGQGGNRIITRTCAALRSDMRTTKSDFAHAKSVMQRKFDERFPQLAGIEMQYTWAGHLCLSSNSVAVACELANGLYSACVQNGLGTTRATLTGIAAAEWVCGINTEVTAYFENEDAPKSLPPKIIRDPAANTILRFKEWKARNE